MERLSVKSFQLLSMTSNNERDFPPAFLRRCISIEMKLSDDREKKIEQLSNMVKAHFQEEKEDYLKSKSL